MSKPKPKSKPIPGSPKYRLAEDGRLFGPMGQCCPQIQQNCRPRSARYSVMIDGKSTHRSIHELMGLVWNVNFMPDQAWVETVRAEALGAEGLAAEAERKEKRKELAQLTASAPRRPRPVTEEWKEIPGCPRYELSSLGRMMGPKGIASPVTRLGKSQGAATYTAKRPDGKSATISIHATMKRVWGIHFIPTKEWIDERRAEAKGLTEEPVWAAPTPAVETYTPEPKVVKIIRTCADCGKVLSAGYWRRCPACWDGVRSGSAECDDPSGEYLTCSSNGRR